MSYLVRQHGFEAAAEVAEVISVLVHLHALAVILDLRVHSIRAFLHGILDGLAGFCLRRRSTTTYRCLSLIHISSNANDSF